MLPYGPCRSLGGRCFWSPVTIFADHNPTQPCIPPGSLNRVPASAGVKTGMSPLPGGR